MRSCGRLSVGAERYVDVRNALPLILLLALLFWFGSARAAQVSRPLSPGNHLIVLAHADRERSAIAHVPPRAIEKSRLPVVFNFHAGVGHVWPGGKQNFLPKILGPSTTIVDANTEMWRFFSRFRLKLS